jgi:hypothetical protein
LSDSCNCYNLLLSYSTLLVVDKLLIVKFQFILDNSITILCTIRLENLSYKFLPFGWKLISILYQEVIIIVLSFVGIANSFCGCLY